MGDDMSHQGIQFSATFSFRQTSMKIIIVNPYSKYQLKKPLKRVVQVQCENNRHQPT
jgi:hypothetical protein